jgi:hypothetical protein
MLFVSLHNSRERHEHYAWLREEIVKREIGEREYEKRERCKKYVRNRVNLKYCLV